MADLAKAYVQIVPSARGMKSGLTNIVNGEMPSGGKSAGSLFGSNLVSTIKSVITTAAIGKALSSTIMAGADLQQSLGGIETLFKDSAATVIANAEQAYKTAGMSANGYMEQVTSFSASLLQSLGGDTAKAAEVADMALTDMSDNANKFGTDMERITDAYQGFAKQNYTMLDNLKLGYGGTKTEMERLLKDAQALTGVKYDINNLSDVYNAIHVIQDELGVTGTTALEASETLTGSFNAMKASFTNVLGNLTLGRDIKPSLNALAQTTVTFLKGNLAPDGSVVKRSAVCDEMLVHEGPARIFESDEEATEAIKSGKINPGDVIVIRYEGPKGGPGTGDECHCHESAWDAAKRYIHPFAAGDRLPVSGSVLAHSGRNHDSAAAHDVNDVATFHDIHRCQLYSEFGQWTHFQSAEHCQFRYHHCLKFADHICQPSSGSAGTRHFHDRTAGGGPDLHDPGCDFHCPGYWKQYYQYIRRNRLDFHR